MDRPIIFSAPMITALLAGNKSMTRRLAWRFKGVAHAHDEDLIRVPTVWQSAKPGDLLWVRENAIKTPAGIAYAADGADHYGADGPLKVTPSIHMPRWASRLTLEVTATRIERLQEISEEDAFSEGCHGLRPSLIDGELTPFTTGCRRNFQGLWNHLHGPGSWEANPEVVAISFTVHKRNVDS